MWRLGIDLGTNSLGWAALDLIDGGGALIPAGLKDCGVRIFSDGRNPKDKQSNAAKRREPRGARKNRDRYKRRRDRLLRQLIQFRLMPEDLAARKALEGGKGTSQTETDPWILRARALNEKISLHQLGRALFHLHQRRGFKSNRKTDRADNEKGKVYDAIARTKERLAEANAKTIGDYFGKERLKTVILNRNTPKGKRSPQPLARVGKSGEGAKWQYDYYPTRELIIDEFDQIWAKQREYYNETLTEEARSSLRNTIEWQHPLKAQPVGKCTLMPKFPRASKALPSSQRVRIFQDVNNLRIMPAGEASYPLSKEHRDIIVDKLLYPSSKTAKRTFDQIRKLIGLSVYDGFNLESEKRRELTGDTTAAALMQEERWGKSWLDLDLATQDEIVNRLIEDESDEVLVNWLCDKHGLDRKRAIGVAECTLPDGYGNLSKQAIDQILPHLEAEVIVYSDAVKRAGMDHSQFGTGEIFEDGLPYYGVVLEHSVAFGTGEPNDLEEKRVGKIANPTVHVALNQIRAVVNDLIRRFGAPEQIVLELARDLPLSAKGKSDLESRQKQNQQDNERRAKDLDEKYGGQPNTYENRMRLRLYEELDALGKRCVFSGEPIGAQNLFSPEVEIEHILPFSKTFDDGFNNKTLSTRKANRDKGNRTPFDAFSHSPDGYDWEEISKRAQELTPGKRWRFAPDAMERFDNEERDFIARQLTDTQYISRLAKTYLESIYGGQGQKGSTNKVWVIAGRLTADLRHYWGLNSVLLGDNLPESEAQKKNRNDHRHHAIDAIVIACTDRSMLQKAAREAQDNERQFNDRLLVGVPLPWENFRSDVETKIRQVIVSHKPDHGFQDAIFADTAMALAPELEEESDQSVPMVKKYIPIDSLEPNHLDPGKKKNWTVVDPDIRVELAELTQGLKEKDFKVCVCKWAKERFPKVGRLRVYKRETVLGVSQKTGLPPYKYYSSAGNYCYDIWLNEKGKWDGEIINTFQAYQLARQDPKWWEKLTGRHGQSLVMRLRKGDCLEITDRDQTKKIVQVYKFSGGSAHMHVHFEADASRRISKKEISDLTMTRSSLQKANAKRVTVSPSGVANKYG